MPDDVSNNLAVMRQFFTEFMARGDMSIADATMAPDICVISGMLPQGSVQGREGVKTTIAALVDAFDATAPLEIIDQFASVDGRRIVTRFRSRGRHVKRFFGLEATNREITFEQTYIAKLERGRIVEIVNSTNNLEFAMLMAPILAPMILK